MNCWHCVTGMLRLWHAPELLSTHRPLVPNDPPMRRELPPTSPLFLLQLRLSPRDRRATWRDNFGLVSGTLQLSSTKAVNPNVTMKTYTQRKNSRTRSHEEKVKMQDITSKDKVMKYVDKNLECNTDLIEMMELKHLMSQVAHDLRNGETRHESRETDAHETHQGATRKLNSMTSRHGGVLEERVYARGPHHMSTTYKAQPQRLALCPRCHPAWASEGTPVGPGKDTHGTPGPEQRGGRGWPTPTGQKAKRTCHDARSSESNT